MGNRIVAAAVLLTAASSAWGLSVTVNPNTVNEGDGVVPLTISLARDATDPTSCTVDVTVVVQETSITSLRATANEDFVPVTGNFTMTVTDTSLVAQETLNVEILEDDLAEPRQEFQVTTSIADNDCVGLNPPPPQDDFVAIFDNDPGAVSLTVDQTVVTVNEADGTVDLGATVSGEQTVEGDFFISVAWQLVDGSAQIGSDYNAEVASGNLVFTSTDLTNSVIVDLLDDAIGEPTEDFTLELTSVFAQLPDESPLDVAVPASSTQVVVNDDDAGQAGFASASYQVNEAAGSATITVSRNGGSTGALSVDYATVDNTATAGSDYDTVAGTLTWADGDTADKTFTVPILDDGEAEADELVTLQLSDAVGQTQEAILTIVDDEQPATTGFSSTDVSASASDGSVILTLIRSGGTQGSASVDYVTEDGTAIAGEDYVAASGTVTWADGDATEKTVVIELIDDQETEPESFSVVLSNPTGAAVLGDAGIAIVTIATTRDIADIPSLNPNQRQLAGWIDQACPRLDTLGELTPEQQDLADLCGLLRDTGTDDATVREALDAINPEELQVSTINALRLTGLQHGNLGQRLNALRNGASGIDLTGLTLEVEGQQIAGTALQEMFNGITGGGASADEGIAGHWGAFINGRIATGDKDDGQGEAGFDFDLHSVTFGVDYRIRPNLIAGVSGGFGSVDTDYKADAGSLDIDSWNTAAYLTYFREESFYLDALATYGENDYDSKRNILFGINGTPMSRLARGETDGNQYSFGIGSGWDFSRGGFVFGPHFGGYYSRVEVDGFSEFGAGGLDVAIEDQTSESMTLNGGGHVSYAWLTGFGVLVPNAKVDWVRELEDDPDTLSFRFVNDPFTGDPNDPSPTITLRSGRPDESYFIWSVGMSAQFIYGLSGFVNYQSYAGYEDVSIDEWSFGARWEKSF